MLLKLHGLHVKFYFVKSCVIGLYDVDIFDSSLKEFLLVFSPGNFPTIISAHSRQDHGPCNRIWGIERRVRGAGRAHSMGF